MNEHRLGLAAFLLLAVLVPASAVAQNGSFAVDEALAKRGKQVWENTGCMICHRIGTGRSAGPDLKGLYERRSVEWVTRFLKNTTEMLESDSVAMELLAQFKNTKMPQVRLNDRDISAVMHYIAKENGGHSGR